MEPSQPSAFYEEWRRFLHKHHNKVLRGTVIIRIQILPQMHIPGYFENADVLYAESLTTT